MGVQTFDENLLKSLGRLHAPHQVYQAYDWMRELGFENINLDLIIAIPGQTKEALDRDLEEVFRLSPEHVSTYCLTFEEDTALYVKLSEGKIKRDVEAEAEFYTYTWDRLGSGGYTQYEISNFAKGVGQQCRHNLDTWGMQEWIGFGPSASSQYQGRRFTNPHDIDAWLKGVGSGQMAYVDCEALNEDTLAVDSLIFGLRLTGGLDLEGLKVRFPHFKWPEAEAFLDGLLGEGLLEREGNCVRLTLAGKLLADRIGTELLDRLS